MFEVLLGLIKKNTQYLLNQYTIHNIVKNLKKTQQHKQNPTNHHTQNKKRRQPNPNNTQQKNKPKKHHYTLVLIISIFSNLAYTPLNKQKDT